MLALYDGKVNINDRSIVLSDISIRRNQVIGISGVSGCGKTTLIKVLAQIIGLQSGELIAPSYKLGANPVQWLIQQPEFAFNPRLTIKQSLFEAWGNEQYQSLLADFGIEAKWLLRRPQQLSGGQLQRLNIIRGLLPSTQFLLCDEITAHLDMLTQKQIWQALLQHCHRQNIGLLVVSHDQYLLNAVCDHVVYLT